MLNKKMESHLLVGIFMLAFLVLPPLSFADWSVGVGAHHGDREYHRDDDQRFYHENPRYRPRTRFLPSGYYIVWVRGIRYYYYNGVYYANIRGDYVLVNPPVGACVNVIPSDFRRVIIRGNTYYTDDGVYYILTAHHGYKLVANPALD